MQTFGPFGLDKGNKDRGTIDGPQLLPGGYCEPDVTCPPGEQQEQKASLLPDVRGASI